MALEGQQKAQGRNDGAARGSCAQICMVLLRHRGQEPLFPTLFLGSACVGYTYCGQGSVRKGGLLGFTVCRYSPSWRKGGAGRQAAVRKEERGAGAQLTLCSSCSVGPGHGKLISGDSEDTVEFTRV